MAAIYKRELKSYFYSMTGCIFIAFMTLFWAFILCPTTWEAVIPTFPFL